MLLPDGECGRAGEGGVRVLGSKIVRKEKGMTTALIVTLILAVVGVMIFSCSYWLIEHSHSDGEGGLAYAVPAIIGLVIAVISGSTFAALGIIRLLWGV